MTTEPSHPSLSKRTSGRDRMVIDYPVEIIRQPPERPEPAVRATADRSDLTWEDLGFVRDVTTGLWTQTQP